MIPAKKSAKGEVLSGNIQDSGDNPIKKQPPKAAFLEKASKLALKGLESAGGAVISWAATKALEFGAKKLYEWTHQVEIAKNKVNESKEAFHSLSSEVNSINQQLDESNKRMQELTTKGNLTFAEKGELENLQKISKELLLQKDIKEKERAQAAKQLAKDNKTAYDKEFGNQSFSQDDVNNLIEKANSGNGAMYITKKDGLAGYIALLEHNKKRLADAENIGNTQEAGFAASSIEVYTNKITDAIPKLQEYRSTLIELSNSRKLTSEEQADLDKLTGLLKLAYSYTDPGAWNTIELSSIFDASGIEVTKEELIQLSKEGKLDEETLKSYSNLNHAIKNCDFAAKDGQTNMQAFIETVEDMAKSEEAITGVDLSPLSAQIESAAASQSLLNAALAEQNETGSVSKETYIKLTTSCKYLKDAFETTASGITLNTDKLRELTKEENENIQSELKAKQKELSKQYNENSLLLAAYNTRLTDGTNLTETQRIELENLIAAKQADQDETKGQINDLIDLQTQYENTTSKYNAFIASLNSPNSGSHYDTVTSSLDNVKKIADDNLYGTDEFRNFVDYMTYEDMSTASIEELKAAYEQAMQKAQSLFTGTKEGSQNFLSELEASGYASKNEETGLWTVTIEDLDAAAKDAGISVDALKDNLYKLKDYGYEVNIPMNTDGFIDAQEKLDTIDKKINTLQEKIRTAEPDVDTTEWEEQLEGLEQDKLTLKVKIEPYLEQEEAMEKILELQHQIDATAKDTKDYDTIVGELKKQQEEIAQKFNLNLEQIITCKADTSDVQDKVEMVDNTLTKDKTIPVTADVTAARQNIESLFKKPYTAKVLINAAHHDENTPIYSLTGDPSRSYPPSAEASGTAFTTGKWTAGYSGRALVGELGKELLVRNGYAVPIGENGAEYINVRRDDIIFNHLQTRQLEKFGRIPSRGKAYSSGTFASGIAPLPPLSLTPDSIGSLPEHLKKAIEEAKKLASQNKKGADEAEKELKEFNWISRAIDLINKKRTEKEELLDKESTSYAEQRSILEEILELNEQAISTHQAAYENYVVQWMTLQKQITDTLGEETGKSIITKIMNGDTSLQGYKDLLPEDGAKLVDQASDLFRSLEEEQNSYQKSVDQHSEDISKQYKTRLNELASYLNEVSSLLSQAEAEMQLKKTTGKSVTESDYQHLIQLSGEQSELYYEQKRTLEKQLNRLKNEASPAYYELKSQIAGCEEAINRCEQSQAEWNEEILNLPVRRVERYLALLKNIKQDLSNYIDEQAGLGIDTSREQFQELIHLSQKQMDKLLEQQNLLKSNLKNYEYGSDKFQETQNEIQSIDDEISNLIKSQYDWNKSILEIPVNRLSDYTGRLKAISDVMTEVTDNYNLAISAVTNAIDEETDSIGKQKETLSKSYEEKIKPYQEELELLQKQNEERRLRLSLEQAQYDLQRAKEQKKNQVIRNGELVYEADFDALRSANDNLKNAEHDNTVHSLEEQVSGLEKERDSLLENYDQQIEKLDTIRKKWEDITKHIETARKNIDAEEILGTGWKEQILSGNDEPLFDSLKTDYEYMESQKDLYQKQIQSNEKVASLMDELIKGWQNGTFTYEQTIEKFNTLIAAAQNGFSASEHLNAVLGLEHTTDLSTALQTLQNSISVSFHDFTSSLSAAQANSNILSKYTSTWEEIKTSIKEQLELLKKWAEEEAKRKETERSSTRTSKKKKKRRSKTSGSDNPNSGPIYLDKVERGDPDAVKSWNSGNHGNASKEYAEKLDKKVKRHNGMKGGLLEKENPKRERLLSYLSTKDLSLSSNEVMLTALKGEAVFTEVQQEQLIKNFQAASFSSPVPLLASDFSALPQSHSETNVTVQMGDISLPGVKDSDGFAKALQQTFEPTMRQYFTKVFKD